MRTKKRIRAEIQEQQDEGIDWAYCAISAAVITTLVLLSVWVHSAVSAGIAP